MLKSSGLILLCPNICHQGRVGRPPNTDGRPSSQSQAGSAKIILMSMASYIVSFYTLITFLEINIYKQTCFNSCVKQLRNHNIVFPILAGQPHISTTDFNGNFVMLHFPCTNATEILNTCFQILTKLISGVLVKRNPVISSMF